MKPAPASEGEMSVDLDALEIELRARAGTEARASKFMAGKKSERNQMAGDMGALYAGVEPEQTLDWQAADAIKSLRSQLATARAGAFEEAARFIDMKMGVPFGNEIRALAARDREARG